MSTSPALTGQVVVVIGGSSGIGRQTADVARDEGAEIILTGRDPERLEHAAAELGALPVWVNLIAAGFVDTPLSARLLGDDLEERRRRLRATLPIRRVQDSSAAAAKEALSMEYLVSMTTNVPPGTAEQTVDDVRSREAARSRELAAQGHLLRLWRPPLKPGEWRTLGLFAAADDSELEQVLASMPLRVWRTDEVTPLSPHPNDPGRAR
jgi:muconolactone D-isomerase